MSDIAIRAEGLSKLYFLGQDEPKYSSLKDSISHFLSRLWPFREKQESSEGQEFWALRDVSFDIPHGECVGVFGRNGAGKSTLLKILSRITAPTSGKVTLVGRTASLLEVGTGFHPELTGRENIFLNGGILGMGQREIARKFDEIVAFAEIERYIDTPVKRYSSGMYVRLAFAVAAHLEPEILLIDEVLAVGDIQFQKKCLGKMGEVSRSGRTILFVSHNMGAIETLCSTGVFLQKGRVEFNGPIRQAVEKYLQTMSNTENLLDRSQRGGLGKVRFSEVKLTTLEGSPGPFAIGERVRISLTYSAEQAISNPRVIIGVYDRLGLGMTRFDSDFEEGLPGKLPPSGVISCQSEGLCFAPGSYVINVAILDCEGMQDHIQNAAEFEIYSSGFFRGGKVFEPGLAKFFLHHGWSAE